MEEDAQDRLNNGIRQVYDDCKIPINWHLYRYVEYSDGAEKGRQGDEEGNGK